MPDQEAVPSLVEDIYDAAVDPSRWSSVLERVADFVGGSAATLYSKDAGTMSGVVHYYGGDVDPHYTQSYFDTYVKIGRGAARSVHSHSTSTPASAVHRRSGTPVLAAPPERGPASAAQR